MLRMKKPGASNALTESNRNRMNYLTFCRLLCKSQPHAHIHTPNDEYTFKLPAIDLEDFSMIMWMIHVRRNC